MKKSIIPLLGAVLWHGVAVAQNDIPLLRPEEQQAVNAQTEEFNQALMPILSTAAKSTVRVWAGRHRLAYGTVVGDGRRILTKWSEIAQARGGIIVDAAGGEARTATVSGVYENEDIAVLSIAGSPLTPVQWAAETPKLGAFLATTQPDGRPAGFGVVSVLERNLRDTDQAYLGIMGAIDFEGPGVKIERVEPETGAAAAGLKPGNIILKVGERPISGLLELKNSLVGVSPGATVSLRVNAGGAEKNLNIVVGNRPTLPNFPGDRLRQMEHMGGPISRVRDSFSSVIQTDMRQQPDQIGGPVVDLKGKVVGITVARADRTRSFIMPAAAVKDLLKKDPQTPALAQVRRNPEISAPSFRGIPGQGRLQPGSEERLRQHLSEMQRLMDFMREEMESVEPEER